MPGRRGNGTLPSKRVLWGMGERTRFSRGSWGRVLPLKSLRRDAGDLNLILDFRFSDMAEGLHPSGSLVKMSLKKRIFQIAPVVPKEYLNSRYGL